jgi:hypothetical protein
VKSPRKTTITDQLREVQRRLGRLATAAPLPTGSSTVVEPGALSALATGGAGVFYVGPLDDGSYGVYIARDSGNAVFLTSGVDRNSQTWSLFDYVGNVIVADDQAGQGLSRPWLPLPAIPASTGLQVQTTSASFVDVALLPHFWQQQSILALAYVVCSDGTTGGQLQLWDHDNAAALGPPLDISVGSNALMSVGPFIVPGAYLDLRDIRLQALRNAGAGNIGVRAVGLTLGG